MEGHHDWTVSMWIIYSLPNVITGIAYTYIPWRMGLKSVIERIPHTHNALLFRYFIFLCAVHHFTMPLFMYLNMFLLMVVLDSAMAVVSVVAAKYLEFK